LLKKSLAKFGPAQLAPYRNDNFRVLTLRKAGKKNPPLLVTHFAILLLSANRRMLVFARQELIWTGVQLYFSC
jgi:hypothetical protein